METSYIYITIVTTFIPFVNSLCIFSDIDNPNFCIFSDIDNPTFCIKISFPVWDEPTFSQNNLPLSGEGVSTVGTDG
jgi:hypothetical protein